MIETIHFQLLPATFAGWVNRRQALVVGYLVDVCSEGQLEVRDVT